ncbi:uncharacterized protein LOC143804873 [Ranitomeya variabilis]|uniref:uncharacterized protein LOC143804873 n=1 Tax=Ranitomeya variabilis TaxID=490064 RepID=UPI0040559E22
MAAKSFQEHFCRLHGYPEQVLTNQGPAFETKVFQKLCNLYGCKKIRRTPYHPQTNGMCEKMNQVVIDLLKTLPLEERNLWPEKLPDLVDLYTHIPVNSSNCTPAYLMRERPGKFPTDLDMGVLMPETTSPDADWDTERQQQYLKVQECVDRSLSQARQRQKKSYNQQAPATPLVPGEQVLKRKRRMHKLDDQWEAEPCTVMPSNFDNTKVCLISKDGGETSAAVSRDHLKVCPDQLRNKEDEDAPQPIEEEEGKIHTVLGDFPQSWTQVNQAIVVPVLIFPQPTASEAAETLDRLVGSSSRCHTSSRSRESTPC